MDLRLTFDKDIISYDRWRPRYCPELFSEIISYTELDEKKRAVEVGCGTGQATEPILKTGCFVTAVEYGGNMAEYAAWKFKDYKNFSVQNCRFEDYAAQRASADLIYSATAFHWVPDEIGYPKAYDMLKSRGTLALFWNKPFHNFDNIEQFKKIERVYDKYMPGTAQPTSPNFDELHQARAETIKKYGFQQLCCRIYKAVRSFSADDYISLLMTYSDHIALRPKEREALFDGIKEAINATGGVINILDTMDLYLAKKP